MSEAQRTKAPGRPWHLWLTGIVGGLWSAMGVMSFTLTQMNVEAVMSRFPPQQREYFASFPLWATAFWAVGVVGGVIGCLLLLLKKRFAFHVLVGSVIGTTVSTLGGLFFLDGLRVMNETDALGFTAFPIIVAAFLAYYTWAMSKKLVAVRITVPLGGYAPQSGAHSVVNEGIMGSRKSHEALSDDKDRKQ